LIHAGSEWFALMIQATMLDIRTGRANDVSVSRHSRFGTKGNYNLLFDKITDDDDDL
jgi:hypothetical protein